MKMFKRFAAALLVGIMALAMLTACGVTPSAPSMRDTALEKSVAQWTVEWGKNQNLTLTLDPELTEISNKCLPVAVNAVDARLAFPRDQNVYDNALNEQKKVFATAKNGKKAALVPVDFPSEEEVTKKTLANRKDYIRDKLNEAGVKNPTKFGVTVTKQKEYTLVLFVVSE